MQRHNFRKHAALYARQGILSLLLMILTLYLAATSSLDEILAPPVVTQIKVLRSEEYTDQNPVIRLHCDKLYYTGYSNQRGHKANGQYYYALQHDHCLLVLLDNEKKQVPEVLKDYTVNVRLIKDDTLSAQFLSSFAEDMQWSSQSMSSIMLPVVASEPDYHPVAVTLLVVLLIAGSIIFFLSTIQNFRNYRKCLRRHARNMRHAKGSKNVSEYN